MQGHLQCMSLKTKEGHSGEVTHKTKVVRTTPGARTGLSAAKEERRSAAGKAIPAMDRSRFKATRTHSAYPPRRLPRIACPSFPRTSLGRNFRLVPVWLPKVPCRSWNQTRGSDDRTWRR